MRSGHFEAIWSSLAPLLAKLAYCPEGFLGSACASQIKTPPINGSPNRLVLSIRAPDGTVGK